VRNQLRTLCVAAIAVAMQLVPCAQEPAAVTKPPTEKPVGAPVKNGGTSIVPLKLQFVISRYQGDKKISSVPYALSLNIGGPRAGLRMGAQVPYATTQLTDGVKIPAYNYRDVGVGIDVMNQMPIEPGLYKLDVVVEDTSISSSNQVQGAPAISTVPVFRTFRTTNSIVLKDGQTTQLTTAADPITGDVMRVDVTLTVVK
jgi:hypothetical protein